MTLPAASGYGCSSRSAGGGLERVRHRIQASVHASTGRRDGVRYRRTQMSGTLAADGGRTVPHRSKPDVRRHRRGHRAGGTRLRRRLDQGRAGSRCRAPPTCRRSPERCRRGPRAYLLRQFRTLAIFVVVAVVLLFLLPVHDTDGSELAVKIGRSAFFVVGALFTAFIGGTGHVAGHPRPTCGSPPRPGRRPAAGRPPCRSPSAPAASSACSPSASACSAPRCVILLFQNTRRRSSTASASAARCSPCSCASAAASSPRPPTSAPTSSARSSRASPRTTRATRPPSPTTWATTSATAPAWPPTSSSRYEVTLVAAIILGDAALTRRREPALGLVPAARRRASASSPRSSASSPSTPARARPQRPERRSTGASSSPPCSAVLVAIAAFIYLPGHLRRRWRRGLTASDRQPAAGRVGAVAIGLVLAAAHPAASPATSPGPTASPVKDIGKSAQTGPATVVLAGISVGLESAVYAALLIGRRRHRRGPALGGGNLHAVALPRSPSPAPACSPPSASSSRWTPSARSPTTRRASPRCRGDFHGERASGS